MRVGEMLAPCDAGIQQSTEICLHGERCLCLACLSISVRAKEHSDMERLQPQLIKPGTTQYTMHGGLPLEQAISFMHRWNLKISVAFAQDISDAESNEGLLQTLKGLSLPPAGHTFIL